MVPLLDLTSALLLLGAGVAAGVIGTAGGVTSLVSYPALLAAGVPPLAANVTNSVALLGSGATSALGARTDLVGAGREVRRRLPPLVLSSLAGAVLLVVTPPGAFALVVPWLIAAASAVLLLQPRIARWQRGPAHPAAVAPATAAIGLYNGYFGAGAGIATIALLMLTGEGSLVRANAVKNVTLLAADTLPAVLFALSGHVVWAAVWPVGVGAAVGGVLGPRVARCLPPAVLRIAVGVSGLLLAARLLAG